MENPGKDGGECQRPRAGPEDQTSVLASSVDALRMMERGEGTISGDVRDWKRRITDGMTPGERQVQER